MNVRKKRITIHGVEVYVGTTDAGLISDQVGFGKWDPPACYEFFSAMRHMFSSTTTIYLSFVMHWRQLQIFH